MANIAKIERDEKIEKKRKMIEELEGEIAALEDAIDILEAQGEMEDVAKTLYEQMGVFKGVGFTEGQAFKLVLAMFKQFMRDNDDYGREDGCYFSDDCCCCDED